MGYNCNHLPSVSNPVKSFSFWIVTSVLSPLIEFLDFHLIRRDIIEITVFIASGDFTRSNLADFRDWRYGHFRFILNIFYSYFMTHSIGTIVNSMVMWRDFFTFTSSLMIRCRNWVLRFIWRKNSAACLRRSSILAASFAFLLFLKPDGSLLTELIGFWFANFGTRPILTCVDWKNI